MKKKQCRMAILMALLLLLSAGCGKAPESAPETQKPAAATEPAAGPATEPAKGKISPEEALHSLRQAMVETPQAFAVAYLGYHYSMTPDLPVDPLEAMAQSAPGLLEDLPFLAEIPAERVIGEGGDLFCIVPADADATVAVSRGYWDDENGQCIYDDMVYSSMTGEPILVFCNGAGWEPDTQIYISGPSGEMFWCVGRDENGYASQAAFHDFSPYAELLKKDQRGLKESGWVLPTRDQLAGTGWSWIRYMADGTEQSCGMSIQNDFLAVRWNDGEEHVYHDAAWELTYEDDTAVLTVDFGEMAGVLRYNVLYEQTYGELYVSLDVTRGGICAGDEPLFRYMTLSSGPDPLEMVGTWDLGWTEVEDDISGAEPGTQIIEITTDYEGNYRISYTNSENPGWSYYDKALEVVSGELYSGCGNRQWFATVDHIGFGGTEYSLTLLPEGTLLLRNYWEQEGFRSVSHGWYTRISGEDPYTHAISQGWRLPERWEMEDSFWLSIGSYALELTADGSRAAIYDVDAIGAYTEAYSGTWKYADGQLRLSLQGQGKNQTVEDSFPVLMLDGQLWIGRSSSGAALPHFYADTLADVLVQPKG